MNLTVLATLGGVVLTALVTYIVAARRMSGKIATSDASDLWAESAKIREDYREQLQKAGARVTDLETRMANLEREKNDLLGTNLRLQAKVDAQEGVIVQLKGTITNLEATIKEMEGAA